MEKLEVRLLELKLGRAATDFIGSLVYSKRPAMSRNTSRYTEERIARTKADFVGFASISNVDPRAYLLAKLPTYLAEAKGTAVTNWLMSPTKDTVEHCSFSNDDIPSLTEIMEQLSLDQLELPKLDEIARGLFRERYDTKVQQALAKFKADGDKYFWGQSWYGCGSWLEAEPMWRREEIDYKDLILTLKPGRTIHIDISDRRREESLPAADSRYRKENRPDDSFPTRNSPFDQPPKVISETKHRRISRYTFHCASPEEARDLGMLFENVSAAQTTPSVLPELSLGVDMGTKRYLEYLAIPDAVSVRYLEKIYRLLDIEIKPSAYIPLEDILNEVRKQTKSKILSAPSWGGYNIQEVANQLQRDGYYRGDCKAMSTLTIGTLRAIGLSSRRLEGFVYRLTDLLGLHADIPYHTWAEVCVPSRSLWLPVDDNLAGLTYPDVHNYYLYKLNARVNRAYGRRVKVIYKD